MITKILPEFYKLEVPLPENPLKSINSYVIKGHDRFLVIDTGLNRDECLKPMLYGLKELAVDLKKTDFFITHFHSDHIGLLGNLITDTSRIYFNEVEASIIRGLGIENMEKRMGHVASMFLLYGFPEDELRRALDNHPGYKFRVSGQLDYAVLAEGDCIEVGEFEFTGIETPGHSPGHMCLYEKNKKILISGDHILFDITPNITYWPELGNSLKVYLENLEKIYTLDVELVLPGHRNGMKSHRNRIRELKEHHKNRLNEVVSALHGGNKNVWEIAQNISWEISYRSWHSFPPAQKWFAFGETVAHVKFLEEEGRVLKKEDNGHVSFSLP